MYLQYNNIRDLDVDESIISVQADLDFESNPDALHIENNCKQRMSGVIEGIHNIYDSLCSLDEGLTNHLEFLIAKKAAPSKVLTVSGQILTLHETIQELNQIAGLLSYDGAP